jgi:hypothetical protein
VAERTDFTSLLTDLADAKAALLDAETRATEKLIAAKAAYRDNPTDANRARKAAAVEHIQALRAAVRADRTGTTVAGDAYTEGGYAR